MNWDMALVWGVGLLVGSFVNVLIHRLPRMVMMEHANPTTLSAFNLWLPASHCPHCEAPLKIWHNIPLVSYLLLRGRCGFCGYAISPQYPLVEITTAFIWFGSVWHWGVGSAGFCWAGVGTALLALSVMDWQTTLLPDDLTQGLVWGGLIAASAGWVVLPLNQAVWGAVAGYLSLWSVATVFERITGQQGMGAGDFKLLAGLGAWLGPLALLPVVLLASLSGASVGLFLKFTHRLPLHGYVSFGPFLASAGGVVAVMGIGPIALWMGW